MKLPRFSLRTLFVLVTLAAVAIGWLAWQRHIVQERKQLRDEILASWRGRNPIESDLPMPSVTSMPAQSAVPWYRAMFGETDFGCVFLPEDCDENLVRRVMESFSGDGIYRIGGPKYVRLD